MSSTGSDARQAVPRGDRAAGWQRTMSSWHDDSRKDPEELEREIDETRAEVHATLEALERKLSPEQLLERTLGRVRADGAEFVHNFSETVKQNPMPVLLASIGIAWMMLNGRRGDRDADHGMADDRWARAKGRTGKAAAALRRRGSAARERLEQSQAAVSHASHALADRSTRAAAFAREELSHARSTFGELLEEQPLVLGAIGLAAGAIVGAALPPTEEEDRALGSARDEALELAKAAGAEAARAADRGEADGGEPQSRRAEHQPEREHVPPEREQLRQPGAPTAEQTPPL